MVWAKGTALESILGSMPQSKKSVVSTVKAVKPNYAPRSWQEKEREQQAGSNAIYDLIRQRNDFHVSADPEYDWASQAEKLAMQIGKIKNRTAAQRATNAGIAVANSNVNVPFGNPGGGNFNSFLRAISGQESGGNYGAVNSSSGALGKYQIMPSNVGAWSAEALGRSITPQQFLSNPKLQEQIASYKLRQYFDKYGPAGAASAWYSGNPNAYKNNSPQRGGPSISAYVQAILKRMGM